MFTLRVYIAITCMLGIFMFIMVDTNKKINAQDNKHKLTKDVHIKGNLEVDGSILVGKFSSDTNEPSPTILITASEEDTMILLNSNIHNSKASTIGISIENLKQITRIILQNNEDDFRMIKTDRTVLPDDIIR